MGKDALVDLLGATTKSLDLNSYDMPEITDAQPDFVGYQNTHHNLGKILNPRIPSHNYMGDGTDVVTSLQNDIYPVDQADYLSLTHDWKYLLAKDQWEITTADIQFLQHARSPEAALAGSLLLAKSALGINDAFVENANLTDFQRDKLNYHYQKIVEHYLKKDNV